MPDAQVLTAQRLRWAGSERLDGVALPRRAPEDRYLPIAAAAVLAGTVIFNPFLAWVNATIMPIDGSKAALAQGALTVAALGIGFYSAGKPYGDRGITPWVIVIWLLAMTAIITAAIREQFDPKSFGEVLLIPAFIMLGMQFSQTVFIRTVMGLQAAVLAVGLWECIDPAGFGSFFKVAKYYISSRGYSADDFWAGGDLFVSAQRPQGRLLFPGSGLHRGSSLFLEPVSLGNWTIMITLFLIGLWDQLSVRQRALMIVSNLILIVICDGRLALGVSAALIAIVPLARRLPGWISVTYLPVSLIALAVAKMLGLLAEVGDTFAGRLRYGIDALGRLSIERFFAIGASRTGNEDAGLVYFIQNQSLPIAVTLWVIVTLTDTGEDRGGRGFKHGMAIFLVACLPISNASLSIKTTALMWACFGYFYARARAQDNNSQPLPVQANE